MYVVVENTPGYLPEETDPAKFVSYEGAVSYAMDKVAEYLDERMDMEADEGLQLYHVTAEGDPPMLWRISCNSPRVLDRVIEIMEDDETE